MKKILVANRGEIALRVMRTARKMGIKTVAVYSEADRTSPHVQFADEAVLLGPPPSNQSYLLGKKIIAEAKKRGVDGIHPGYGFLSENAAFAKEVSDAGIIFIGPSPNSIEIMGSKLAAKEAVLKFDIPMVPGTPGAINDVNEAKIVSQKAQVWFRTETDSALPIENILHNGQQDNFRFVERFDILINPTNNVALYWSGQLVTNLESTPHPAKITFDGSSKTVTVMHYVPQN